MNDDFIRDLNLELIQDDDIGDFWGGDDVQGEHHFEVFITADEDGPSPRQIEHYRNMVSAFDRILTESTSALQQKLRESIDPQHARYRDLPIQIIFVSVLKDDDESDIELTCEIERKAFLFKKRLSAVVCLKDNRLTETILN
ncbi:hypothetical protein KQH82_07530 [bacterium]|nr:hypothetical protein [bacterium]